MSDPSSLRAPPIAGGDMQAPVTSSGTPNNSSDVRVQARVLSGRSRPRASLACMNCRQRKVKCIKLGSNPNAPCTCCRSLRIPCVVSRDGDRRKTGSREQVAMLQDRVQMLESLVRQNAGIENVDKKESIQSPPESVDVDGATRTPRATLSVSSPDLRSPKVEASYSQDFDADRDDISPDTESSLTATRHSVDRQSDASPSLRDGFGGVSDQSPVQHNKLEPNVGRMTPLSEKNRGGLQVDNDRCQSRFYGSTCQPYIQHRPDDSLGESSWADEDGVVEVKLDSSPLRALLFQTFWKVQPLSQALIEQDRFQSGRNRAMRSQWYSPFLENVILASATRISTSANVRALGPRYAAHAKAAIASELENPNIAGLQGFLLLSDFEATRGKDRLGYMYCSIACRLAFDLGLHENCDELIAQGKLSSSEAHSRYILFLGTFVYDALWTLYLGRPSAIPVAFLTAAKRCAANHGWSAPPTLEAWVGLGTDILQATEVLNGAAPMDERSLERVAYLDAKIHQRARELPPWLALRNDDISELDANVYGLHVQFAGIRIVLHKLLSQAAQARATAGSSSPSTSASAQQTLENSRSVMYDNALRIARLVSAYQQIFGIENLVVVMLDNMYVAAAVLVSHILRLLAQRPSPAQQAIDRDLRWVRILADLLAKAQTHYPVTARVRSTLATFVRETPLAGMFGTWSHGGETHDSTARYGQGASSSIGNASAEVAGMGSVANGGGGRGGGVGGGNIADHSASMGPLPNRPQQFAPGFAPTPAGHMSVPQSGVGGSGGGGGGAGGGAGNSGAGGTALEHLFVDEAFVTQTHHPFHNPHGFQEMDMDFRNMMSWVLTE